MGRCPKPRVFCLRVHVWTWTVVFSANTGSLRFPPTQVCSGFYIQRCLYTLPECWGSPWSAGVPLTALPRFMIGTAMYMNGSSALLRCLEQSFQLFPHGMNM